MRRFLLAIALIGSTVNAVWPIPKDIQLGKEFYILDELVEFKFNDESASNGVIDNSLVKRETYENGTAPPTSKEVVNFAIYQARNYLFHSSFIPSMLRSRTKNWEPTEANATSRITKIELFLTGDQPKNVANVPTGQLDESYEVVIERGGLVRISAPSSIGLSYGLSTFSQLFYYTPFPRIFYTPYAPATIRDSPLYPHRGLNLDISRSFYPLVDLKRTIQAMSYNKLNRLHLHATDSQSWPLDIPSKPDLAAKGAYGPEMIYTADDVADLQKFAALQGVQLIFEIDMPGHVGSIAFGYPDMVVAFNEKAWTIYGGEPPTGTFPLNSTQVDTFLSEIMDDLLPRISDKAVYFHTGGDEVNLNSYKNDKTVQSSSKEVLQPLVQRFVDNVHKKVRENNLTPIVWEEMLLEWNLKLPKDTIVQSWKDSQSVAKIASAGHRVIAGSSEFWYFDCGYGAWVDAIPSKAASRYPYADWCSPRKNWRLAYTYDPVAGLPPNSEMSKMVLGGEAHLWSEQSDPMNLDTMLWPRLSAVAEVLWSGPKDASGNNRSQVEASPRLADMRERLVAQGVRSEPVRMQWCQTGGGCQW